MSKKYINKENLSISEDLYKFINEEAIPGTEVSKEEFWKGLSKISHELNPKNIELLRTRKKLQIEIDKWHLENYDKEFNLNEYKSFLEQIGYLKKCKRFFYEICVEFLNNLYACKQQIIYVLSQLIRFCSIRLFCNCDDQESPYILPS